METTSKYLRHGMAQEPSDNRDAKSPIMPDFQYTLPNSVLTVDERKFYENYGYLLVKNLFSHSLLDLFCQRFVDICKNNDASGFTILTKDPSLAKAGAQGEYLFNKVQHIAFDEVLSKYMVYPKLLDYVECFTGPNIMCMNSMVINKPPGADRSTSLHPLHQDLHYFTFGPADRIVGTWTAMERATVDNGCLFVLPGTHKCDLFPHVYPDSSGSQNKMFHGISGFDDHPKVYLEMEKGDALFFHPLLIHGSGPNLTTDLFKAKARLAMGVRINL